MRTVKEIAIAIVGSGSMARDMEILKKWAEEILNEAAKEAEVAYSEMGFERGFVDKQFILKIKDQL